MNLQKPLRINSNLNNGKHLSCGLNSIFSILSTLNIEFNIEELNDKLEKFDSEIKFGGLFNINNLIKALDFIKESEGINIEYEVREFKSAEELESILKSSDKYALICYYALQGFIRVSKNPSMEHAHYGIIYKYRDGKLTGSQSNNKADMLKCIENVDIDKFFDSCNTVNKIKVNWGKYNKCQICIGKKQLDEKARCGEEECKLGLHSTSDCLYRPTIGNKVIFIGVGDGHGKS